MQGWGWASAQGSGLRRDGELEEGSRKRALRSDGDDATPPKDPRSLGSPQHGGGAGRPRTSKDANEGGSLRVPAPPDFQRVASTASCAPCHKLRQLHTISIRRASWTGTSRFMADKATLRPTRAPASWQTRATARSRGSARDARTPKLEQAAR